MSWLGNKINFLQTTPNFPLLHLQTTNINYTFIYNIGVLYWLLKSFPGIPGNELL